MSPGVFIALAILFAAVVAAHVWYLRMYGEQLTRMTRTVMWFNVSLIAGVTAFLGYVAFFAKGS